MTDDQEQELFDTIADIADVVVMVEPGQRYWLLVDEDELIVRAVKGGRAETAQRLFRAAGFDCPDKVAFADLPGSVEPTSHIRFGNQGDINTRYRLVVVGEA